jgi:nucleotide-binding universal stress UspA family protein
MYRHILLPTDGSKLALKGARAGIELARALGAKVTAVYVAPEYLPPIYGEAMVYAVPGGYSSAAWKKHIAALSAKALGAVEREARKAGVRFAGHRVTDAQPWAGILRAARARKCDTIAMASHGRGGLGGLLLGSETSRVLAHSKFPVIVIR